MTFPTYEKWGEKVAEQVIDVYLINGRTIREWIKILSDELTMLDKIRAEIEKHAKVHQNLNTDRARALCWCLDVIDKYTVERSE